MDRYSGGYFIRLLLIMIRWPISGATIMINLHKEKERHQNPESEETGLG